MLRLGTRMKRMYYEDWNDLIAQKFFCKEMVGKEVLLYVTKDVLDLVGRDTGVDFQDFIRCIKEGPADSVRQGICQKAILTTGELLFQRLWIHKPPKPSKLVRLPDKVRFPL